MAETLRIIIDDDGGAPGGGSVPVPGGGAPGGSPVSPGGSPVPPPIPPPVAVPPKVPGVKTPAGPPIKTFAKAGGIALAAFTVAVGTAVVTIKKLSRSIETQVELIGGLSAEVAAAQANTTISRQLGKLRRAERIGPEVARAEKTRSEFERALFDVNTEILKILLSMQQVVEPGLQVALGFLQGFNDLATNRNTQIDAAIALLIPGGAAAVAIKRHLMNEQARKEAEADPFGIQLESLLPRDQNGSPLFWPADLAEPT